MDDYHGLLGNIKCIILNDITMKYIYIRKENLYETQVQANHVYSYQSIHLSCQISTLLEYFRKLKKVLIMKTSI